jgi:hypothetical protein
MWTKKKKKKKTLTLLGNITWLYKLQYVCMYVCIYVYMYVCPPTTKQLTSFLKFTLAQRNVSLHW